MGSRKPLSILSLTIALGLIGGACAPSREPPVGDRTDTPAPAPAATPEASSSMPGRSPAMPPASAGTAHQPIDSAVAVLHPTAGSSCTGEVRFRQFGNSVRIVADVEGLQAGSTHAIHVHENGDCSADDGTSAGGHYDPAHHRHGLPAQQLRHAGDMGNLTADAAGRAHYELTVENMTISGERAPILGRAVIVHAGEDDGGQPTGNAGARLACGVIGAAQPPAQRAAH